MPKSAWQNKIVKMAASSVSVPGERETQLSLASLAGALVRRPPSPIDMHFLIVFLSLLSMSSEPARELFKSGLFCHYSFIVLLDMFLVSFQSWVFWGFLSPVQNLRGNVPYMELKSFTPQGK